MEEDANVAAPILKAPVNPREVWAHQCIYCLTINSYMPLEADSTFAVPILKAPVNPGEVWAYHSKYCLTINSYRPLEADSIVAAAALPVPVIAGSWARHCSLHGSHSSGMDGTSDVPFAHRGEFRVT